ncbi:MAG: cell filamentation protein Fic [Solirubrobacterales bacterium 67-14]|nr:MAG: cell filamentation protein Fic [Solirubrobacterales bacterium 67-14]
MSTEVGSVDAFLPAPLPPNPPLEVDTTVHGLQAEAMLELGRLDGLTSRLPDPDQFLFAFARKEAVLSSQIEGTQSSLSDLMLFERGAVPEVPADDVQEAVNYVLALNHGLDLIRSGVPISLRLIREMHGILLRGARGGGTGAGDFRGVPNWIGGIDPTSARYVPPPPNLVPDAMGFLEAFLHGEPEAFPILLRAGMAHAQFEAIHPFLDGNGRVGRLLVTMMLSSETADGLKPVLGHPLLYLSLYLKKNRTEYYDRLLLVTEKGDWEGWITFFLKGVIAVARSTIETTRRILTLLDADRERVASLGRRGGSALQVFEVFSKEVVLKVPEIVVSLGVSEPTASKAVRILEAEGIVTEVTGQKRNRIFVYREFLKILNEGTEHE